MNELEVAFQKISSVIEVTCAPECQEDVKRDVYFLFKLSSSPRIQDRMLADRIMSSTLPFNKRSDDPVAPGMFDKAKGAISGAWDSTKNTVSDAAKNMYSGSMVEKGVKDLASGSTQSAIENTISDYWKNTPSLRYGLYAGLGGAGLGLARNLTRRRNRKKNLLSDVGIGLGLGGLGGAAYGMAEKHLKQPDVPPTTTTGPIRHDNVEIDPVTGQPKVDTSPLDQASRFAKDVITDPVGTVEKGVKSLVPPEAVESVKQHGVQDVRTNKNILIAQAKRIADSTDKTPPPSPAVMGLGGGGIAVLAGNQASQRLRDNLSKLEPTLPDGSANPNFANLDTKGEEEVLRQIRADVNTINPSFKEQVGLPSEEITEGGQETARRALDRSAATAGGALGGLATFGTTQALGNIGGENRLLSKFIKEFNTGKLSDTSKELLENKGVMHALAAQTHRASRLDPSLKPMTMQEVYTALKNNDVPMDSSLKAVLDKPRASNLGDVGTSLQDTRIGRTLFGKPTRGVTSDDYAQTGAGASRVKEIQDVIDKSKADKIPLDVTVGDKFRQLEALKAELETAKIDRDKAVAAEADPNVVKKYQHRVDERSRLLDNAKNDLARAEALASGKPPAPGSIGVTPPIVSNIPDEATLEKLRVAQAKAQDSYNDAVVKLEEAKKVPDPTGQVRAVAQAELKVRQADIELDRANAAANKLKEVIDENEKTLHHTQQFMPKGDKARTAITRGTLARQGVQKLPIVGSIPLGVGRSANAMALLNMRRRNSAIMHMLGGTALGNLGVDLGAKPGQHAVHQYQQSFQDKQP